MRPTALLLILLLESCNGESKVAPFPSPPLGYQYAYATPDCAPWDGPAVTISLTGQAGDSLLPTAPHLQLSLFAGLDELPGRSFTWPEDTRKGNLFECPSAESCRLLGEGWVRIAEISKDSTVWGEVRLLTAAGDTVQGGFRARWHARRIMCG